MPWEKPCHKEVGHEVEWSRHDTFNYSRSHGPGTGNFWNSPIRARGRLTAITAAEKVFGFGAPALGADRAEVITEVARRDGQWVLGPPRALDATAPLSRPTSRVITAWLQSPSPRELGGGPYD